MSRSPRIIAGSLLVISYMPVGLGAAPVFGIKGGFVTLVLYAVGMFALRCPGCRRGIFQDERGWWTPIVRQNCRTCGHAL